MSEVLGEPVVYRPLDWEAVRAAGFPGAGEVGNMLEYFEAAEKDIVELIDRDLLRELNPRIQTFEGWLREYEDDLPRG